MNGKQPPEVPNKFIIVEDHYNVLGYKTVNMKKEKLF